MNILQVTAALEQGGVERGTVEMAAFIVSKGAKSFVASQGGRMVYELEKEGTTHIKLPLEHRNPFSILYSAFALKRLIQLEGIDLVHARSRAPAWAAFLACRMTGTKFVTTFHGAHKIQNRFKRFYNSSMIKGERVIAISQFIKDHIIDNYGVDKNRIDIARRGVDPQIFNPDIISASGLLELKKSLGITGDGPIISLPGRLTRWKGQALFIEALSKIQDLQWTALLVGGAGKKKAYLHELQCLTRQLGIANRVIFCGSQADIVPYYAISNLVVSASTEPEAFGRVAVEAQAMGKPVIVSEHGGALETVLNNKTGWYFRNGDVFDLASRLRLTLESSENLPAIGASARKWVQENFTVERMCEAEWDSYQSQMGL